jgi:ribosomal protein S18 acetylase RimI-like enzyme
MWSEYFKEREGYETLQNEKACLTYKIAGEECYIKDIFVLKEHRRSSVGSSLADKCAEIAISSGCKFLSGTVVPSTNGSTSSLKGLLAYGFEVKSSHEDLIILTKVL